MNEGKVEIWIFFSEDRHGDALPVKNGANRKAGVMVLGGITEDGLGFFISVSGKLNAMAYRDILADNLVLV